MRILLVRDDGVGRSEHLRGQMRVKIEFGSDHRALADESPATVEYVAFAIVVALRDHRTVQVQ